MKFLALHRGSIFNIRSLPLRALSVLDNVPGHSPKIEDDFFGGISINQGQVSSSQHNSTPLTHKSARH